MVFHSICTIFASIMDIETLEGIRKCPLFEGLTDNEIIDLMHVIRYRVVRLYKGDFLFVAGEDCLHANILIDGEVVAYLEGASDRYIRMSTFHAGNMFAPAFLFARNRRYPVTVQTTTNTRVLRILSADFERLLELDSRLSKNFTVILSNLIAGLTKKVGMLLRGTTPSAVQHDSAFHVTSGTGRSFRHPEVFPATCPQWTSGEWCHSHRRQDYRDSEIVGISNAI